MIRKIITASALMLCATLSMAQNMSANGQNYINKYSVAPAYAGFNGNTEGFLGMRSVMTGINGAPQIMRADMNGSFMGNMGYGVQIINEKSGNFQNTVAAVTYAYHLPLSSDMNLSLALSPALIRSSYNLGQAITESSQPDPVFINQAGMSATGFDAGFSVLFNMQNLFFSINAPRLICKDLEFMNGISNTNRKIDADVSYILEMDKLEIEPIANVGYVFDEGVEFKGAVVAKYNKYAWMQLSYSSENWIGIGAGFAATGRIAVNYQYETGTSLIAKQGNGTHEVSVGFLISRPKNVKATRKPSVFFSEDPKTDTPKKNDNAIEKKLMNEIKRLDNKIDNYHSGANADNDSHPSPQDNPDSWVNNEEKEEQEVEAQWEAPISLPSVKFGYGSSKMFSSSYPAITKFVSEMIDDSSKKIMIIAYVDCMGSKSYAKELAQKRAEAVKSFMTSKGIAGSRIVTKGAITRSNKMNIEPSLRYDQNFVQIRYKK